MCDADEAWFEATEVAKNNQVITGNIKRVIYDTKEISAKICQALSDQDKQISRLTSDVSKVNYNLKVSRRKLRSIRSVTGTLKNCVTLSPKLSRTIQPQPKTLKFTDASPVLPAKDCPEEFDSVKSQIDKDLEEIESGVAALKIASESISETLQSQNRKLSKLTSSTDTTLESLQTCKRKALY